MSNIVIQAESLGKSYRIRHQVATERYAALRDVFANSIQKSTIAFKNWVQYGSAVSKPKDTYEDFWAIKDLSFQIRAGDTVGIIGRNGAGKSTLLKVLSRITEPTCGRVTIQGRIASLLEVGTGFHPELTGRENIFLNGAILGMSRTEIRRNFNEIVEFAEVEKFLDTPVKRYSSGMYVRLAFAVAAHLESEILVVDEVLAVGDAKFQSKCLGKMQNISKAGRTVVFVSHNLTALRSLCDTGIVLHNGELICNEKLDIATAKYLSLNESHQSSFSGKLTDELVLVDFSMTPNPVDPDSPTTVTINLLATQDCTIQEMAIVIFSERNERVAIVDLRALLPQALNKETSVVFESKIDRLPFVEGNYYFGVYVATNNISLDSPELFRFEVSSRERKSLVIPYPAKHRGTVELDFKNTFAISPISE